MDFEKNSYFCVPGEMAEWSNAAVLKTVVPLGTGGSNPSLSANKNNCPLRGIFIFGQLPNLFSNWKEIRMMRAKPGNCFY